MDHQKKSERLKYLEIVKKKQASLENKGHIFYSKPLDEQSLTEYNQDRKLLNEGRYFSVSLESFMDVPGKKEWTYENVEGFLLNYYSRISEIGFDKLKKLAANTWEAQFDKKEYKKKLTNKEFEKFLKGLFLFW
jgi:hypothetical protein